MCEGVELGDGVKVFFVVFVGEYFFGEYVVEIEFGCQDWQLCVVDLVDECYEVQCFGLIGQLMDIVQIDVVDVVDEMDVLGRVYLCEVMDEVVELVV